MRFSVNLSILFKEAPFIERFERAAAAGFRTVEFWWPGGDALAAVAKAVTYSGLEVALFNLDAGDMPAGDRGLLSDPARQAQFRASAPLAIDLAQRVGCRRLNALVGHRLPGMAREAQLDLARENVAWIADAAQTIGADVLIEAVNTIENGPYLLARTADALDFIHSVNRPNVRLQYDMYHMQRMEGNLVATLRNVIGEVGHIQIADSPGRNEPGTGEIRYPYVLQAIEDLGYSGYVGLEYNAKTTTEESLDWLPRELRGADAHVADLNL